MFLEEFMDFLKVFVAETGRDFANGLESFHVFIPASQQERTEDASSFALGIMKKVVKPEHSTLETYSSVVSANWNKIKRVSKP